MPLDVTAPDPLIANAFRIERVEFVICNPPEVSTDLDENGNPLPRYAYTSIHILDHMDGKPVRRLVLGNEVWEAGEIETLLGMLQAKAAAYAAATGLTPG